MKQSKLKISDLIEYAMRAQRLSGADYGGSHEAYKSDRNNVIRGKRAAKKAADFYWYYQDTHLVVGEYFGTRLFITENSLEYITGQYTPTEIWWALEDYLNKTRGL